MATVNKDIADKLIAGNGRIDPEDTPDNPWAIRIVEYDNAWGGKGYGVTFEGENPHRYLQESQYVRNPKIIWEKKD